MVANKCNDTSEKQFILNAMLKAVNFLFIYKLEVFKDYYYLLVFIFRQKYLLRTFLCPIIYLCILKKSLYSRKLCIFSCKEREIL